MKMFPGLSADGRKKKGEKRAGMFSLTARTYGRKRKADRRRLLIHAFPAGMLLQRNDLGAAV